MYAAPDAGRTREGDRDHRDSARVCCPWCWLIDSLASLQQSPRSGSVGIPFVARFLDMAVSTPPHLTTSEPQVITD